MKGGEEAAGGQHQGAPWQDGPPVVHPLQVASRHVRHADGPRRAVQELVAVPEGEGETRCHGDGTYRCPSITVSSSYQSLRPE